MTMYRKIEFLLEKFDTKGLFAIISSVFLKFIIFFLSYRLIDCIIMDLFVFLVLYF